MIAQKLVILTRNIKVSDRMKTSPLGRPNILSWISAVRTSVVPKGFPTVTDVIQRCPQGAAMGIE
jgi:hypothetical protein